MGHYYKHMPSNTLARVDVSYDSLINPRQSYDLAKKLCTKDMYFFNANALGMRKPKPDWWDKPLISTLNGDLVRYVYPDSSWLSMLQAVRIRFCLSYNRFVKKVTHDACNWARQNNIPIIWTPQRFKGVESSVIYLAKKVKSSAELYKLGYYRAGSWFKPGMSKVREIINQEYGGINDKICDEQNLGCGVCGTCISSYYNFLKKSVPEGLSIVGLNTGSGCLYSCCCCYVRLGQNNNKVAVGVFLSNSKMEKSRSVAKQSSSLVDANSTISVVQKV